MDENRSSDYILMIIKNLNLLTLLYIATIMERCLSGYIQENSALDFLRRIDIMPVTAWKISVISVGLYGSCLLLLQIRNVSSRGLFVRVCIELGISFWICCVTGFCYTGIVLMILADAMQYFPRARWKFPLAIVICMFYLLIDYNLLSAHYEMIPLEAYLDYYQKDIRSVLLGIKNVLSSLNMLVFLVFIIILMREQLSEKERILCLNGKLNAANEELKRANLQLEAYAEESGKEAEARERNRLAREIHDTLGHSFVGIITGIEACMALMDVAPEATKEQLRAIAEVARKGMTDVRRSVKALRPDALEKMDLERALTMMVDEMRSATNAEIVYQCTTSLNCFETDEEDIIYRIVQESITNSIRHGKAKRIEVLIDRDYNMLKISIRDNGIGCAQIQKGFGLHHMEERLNMLRGSLKYNGENGFEVEAQIPIRWGTEERD